MTLLNLQVGEYGKAREIGISIIAIEGESCSLAHVSQCADLTGGTVNVLHPLELVRQIRVISQNPVVATDVQLSVILHPSLELDRTISPQVRRLLPNKQCTLLIN